MRQGSAVVIWSNAELDCDKWKDAFADRGPVPDDE